MERKICIRVKNLTYRYDSASRPALDDLCFEICAGESAAILGANGSGKSTLLGCINGLLTPPEGSALVYDENGQVLDSALPEDLEKIRRMAGTVLQNPDDQIVGSVVEEDAAFGPENLGLSGEEIRLRVDRALKIAGLEALRDRSPQFLSGGERQRLALAGVLAMESGIIILDEAVSMLDPAGRESFLDLLDRLSASGKTIIQVTHSLEEAFRRRRCLVLSHGALVFDGTPGDLLERPELESWGFVLSESAKGIRLLKKRFPGFSVSSLDPIEAAEKITQYMEKNRREKGTPPDSAGTTPPSPPPPPSQGKSLFCFESASHEYLAGTNFAASGMRDVTFELSTGEDRGVSLALIGTSGSGKSTVMKHVNALLLPTRGSVRVMGQDTFDRRTNLAALRMKAALSVQSPESALFEDFVADDVAFGPANAGLSGKALKERVQAAMEETGLPFEEFADRKTGTLSGGEKRRAAIAASAAMDSPLLLLDEPLAGLDGLNREKVRALIRARIAGGKSVVISTHSMETAAAFDLAGVMVHGTMAAFGKPRDLFGPLWQSAWGLELPWTAEVARRLGEKGLVPKEAVPLNAEELLACIAGGAGEAGASTLSVETVPAEPSAPPGMSLQAGKKRPASRKTGLEFFRNVTLGQFLNRPSALRGVGGGLKLFLLVAGMIAAVGLPAITPWGTWLRDIPLPVFPAILLAVVLISGALAGKIEPHYLLRGLRPLAPWLLVIAGFHLLYTSPGDTSLLLARFWRVSVTLGELVRAFSIYVRAAALVALLSLYSAVTPLRETLKAIGAVVSAFVPSRQTARDISMAAGIALRFVPVLTEEAERIVTAQLSRGGKKGRLAMLFSMIAPLFLRALERSEKLAKAMMLRLYGVS